MFSRKSKPAFDLQHELLVVLDEAGAAGSSAYTIREALQARIDALAYSEAVSRPHSGFIPQQFDGYGKPIVR
jgi:hypothetical protein